MSSDDLRAIWADIPDVGCKGLCVESCGPVDGNEEERQLLAFRGITLPNILETLFKIAGGAELEPCPALVDGRCSVYDIRPTVCRLWGATPEMPCPHGCEPTLTSIEGRAILARSLK